MSSHGFESALASAAIWRDGGAGECGGSDDDEKRQRRKKDKKSKKKKDDKEKKSKKRKHSSSSHRWRSPSRHSKKKKKKDKRDSKKKKDSKKRSRKGSSSSGSSSSSSSGSDDDDSRSRSRSRSRSLPNKATTAAAHSPSSAARAFLLRFPTELGGLKGLIKTLDAGGAVDVSGVPSAEARTALAAVFGALGAASSDSFVWINLDETRPLGAMERLAGVFQEEERAARGGEERAEVGPAAAAVGPPPPKREEPAPVAVIGPAAPPPAPIGPEAPPAPIGPAAPPPELLAAAAAALEDEDEEDIGPDAPPPEVEATEEVSRISKLLSSSDDAAAPSFDSYDVLNLPAGPATTVAAIKRAFRRLSLLTHPDKAVAAAASASSTPSAKEAAAAAAAAAFAAIAAAATELQDPEKRKEVDKARENRDEQRAFAAFVAGRERERAWRRARGEEVDDKGGDVAASISNLPPQREEWMTALPEFERRPPTVAQQQQSVTAFSQRGKRGVEEAKADAGWAEKPGGGRG